MLIPRHVSGHEKYATLLLDHARNRLLTFEILIAGASASISVGAMVAGIFGMNTPTKLFDKEDTPEWVFIMIVLLTTFAVLSVFCCLAFVL